MRIILDFGLIFGGILLIFYIIYKKKKIKKIDIDTALWEITKEYKTTIKLYSNNSDVIAKLYKKARKNEKYSEAFLYFYFLFELSLRYMIVTGKLRPIFLNLLKIMQRGKKKIYYPKREIENAKKIAKMYLLKKSFRDLYGDELKKDIELIVDKRDFIIHKMIKNIIDEEGVKDCFKKVFIEIDPAFRRFAMITSNITINRDKELKDKFNEVAPKELRFL